MKLPEHINELMPASLESERGLLCSFCIDPQNVGAMMSERRIDSLHFTKPSHAALCAIMQDRWSTGKPVNLRMMVKETEDGRGGESEALDILTHVSSARFAEEYADAVIDKYQLRMIIVATSDLHEQAWAPMADPAPILATIGELCAMAAPPVPAKSFKQLLIEKQNRIEHGEPLLDLVPTGISRLDADSPLRLGDMPLIAGERKAGKSILALSIVSNVILRGDSAAVFSLEETTAKVVDRVFAGVSRVPIVCHHKDASELEFQRMARAFHDLSGKNLHIRGDVQHLGPMCAIIRQLKAKDARLVLVMVDYAQLVKVKLDKGAGREQEVAAVSRALRLLAMELHIVILVLCQLNKDGDTRESKALEQDATAMWKIIKLPEELETNNVTNEQFDRNANKRMLAIPFQRNGDGNIAFPVTFFGHIARVENLGDD